MLITMPSVLLLTIIPTQEYRRRLVRSSSRLFFFVTGMRLTTQALGSMPDTACVVISNHASYLDGIILTAALPPNFSFVIKKEVTNIPVVHYLLRRIGSQFVERYNPAGGARDALRIMRAAGKGDELAFFPEGSFVKEPGLRRFHVGAFAVAAHASLPVVPVVILGSRHILPADEWAPAPGRIRVEILEPVEYIEGRSAHELRDVVRNIMLRHVNEPDGTKK
jgi:1-acyl-sn-glycerol-3-phosphate acyltransferase